MVTFLAELWTPRWQNRRCEVMKTQLKPGKTNKEPAKHQQNQQTATHLRFPQLPGGIAKKDAKNWEINRPGSPRIAQPHPLQSFL